MEENNNNENELGKKVKQSAKDITKKGLNVLKNKIIKWLLPIIGGILIILLAMGVILAAPTLVQNMFGSLVSLFTPDKDNNEENIAISNIISIGKNGEYILKSNFSEQILDKLESNKISNTAIGYLKKSTDDVKELEDMIEKYIETEIKTMFPKTGLAENQIDGAIKVQRASVENGKVINLKYKPYDEFMNMTGNDVLNYYSLNPDTFELCIATTSSTTYYDFNGNQISSMTEGEVNKNELDYQTVMQNYAMPFNFLISLHAIAQDVDFMKELVEESMKKELVLTYIDSRSIVTTQNDYEGERKITTITERWPEDSTKPTSTSRTSETININNSNLNNYGVQAEYHKKIEETITGTLQVTKADTWLQTVTKEVGEFGSQGGNSSVEGPNTFFEEYDKILEIWGEKVPDSTDALLIKKVADTCVKEKITTTNETQSYTTTNKKREIKVNEFIEFIKEKYPNVESNLKSAPSALFYLLQQYENTQRLEQIMRYVILMLSGVDYGVTEADLEYLLEEISNTYTSASALLREYIRKWEHSSPPPTNANGTNYIIEDDGYGHPTVGYGVDIENGEFKQLFIENGYPTYIGGEVPIDFVDSVEEMEIENKMDKVKSITSGLDLTQYQINALVSRAFNCGTSGAMDGYTGIDFVTVYKTYWNQERDGKKFEEKDNNADFTHGLFTQFMDVPVRTTDKNGNLVYSPGLDRRRRSEWILFETGYYDVLNKWHMEFSAESILEACEQAAKELVKYGAYYGTRGYNGIEMDSNFERQRCCVCATYVATVLYRTGILEAEHINKYKYHQCGITNVAPPGGIKDMVKDAGFVQVSVEEAQPGDICIWSEHTFIYAGGNEIWDQNCGVDGGSGRSLPWWGSYKVKPGLLVFRAT